MLCEAKTRGREMRAYVVAAPFAWVEYQLKKEKKKDFRSLVGTQATQRPVCGPGLEAAWVLDDGRTSAGLAKGLRLEPN